MALSSGNRQWPLTLVTSNGDGKHRIPALFLNSLHKQLAFYYPYNEEIVSQHKEVIEEMKNYHIVMQLCPEADKSVYRVFLNGQQINLYVVIPSPKIYEKVTLYGSSPWWRSFEDENLGTFENLRVYPYCY